MAIPSYACGTSDTPLLGDTIGDNLRRTMERIPEQEALVVCHQQYRATYRQLWNSTTLLAKALLARGIAVGDRVGIWAPNRHEWVTTQYATARVGAILVNVNPAFKARELEYVTNQSGLRMLLLARSFRHTDYIAVLAEVRHRCPSLEHVVVLNEPDSESDARLDADTWDTLLAQAQVTDDETLSIRERTLSFDDPINIQYTSGTTGSPKGATLSHHNILNNGFFCGEILGYTHVDRVAVPVPFYHCFGMVIGNLACTTHGACIVVPSEAFDARATLAAIAAERCTAVYGVPTMFIAQLNHADSTSTDFSTLRTGVMAGSPCPVEVMKQVREQMHVPEITICYGMTETSPVSTQTRVDDPVDKRVASVGQVQPHVEVKIIEPETGHIVPRGASGELCTRGYLVMLGYWGNDEATRDAIDAAHWMHTGDLAAMDKDGYIRIVGRLKDMIIRGGENIYPREIEEFLYTHPDVEDAQVIGVPSTKYGEEVMAWIKPKAGALLTEDALRAFCKGTIATYKIPHYWKLVTVFPMTVTGKVQKYRMRELATIELGLADDMETT